MHMLTTIHSPCNIIVPYRIDFAVLKDQGTKVGDVMVDEVELGLSLVDLVLEVADDGVAATDRVDCSNIGFKDDGAHGLVLVERAKRTNDLGDIADTEQLVGVLELVLAVVGEIGGEDAIRGALSALVLTSRAGLGAATAGAVVVVVVGPGGRNDKVVRRWWWGDFNCVSDGDGKRGGGEFRIFNTFASSSLFFSTS
ncbi:unnamed protein product [Cuscuta campestris]|uniref:Uncharacterized protein n=1 Tax=Cuscuta campestris TaxID=132261 RepID=A0A484M227_9ASTE|nr:unnamed protein product [Cuscuta campestris]